MLKAQENLAFFPGFFKRKFSGAFKSLSILQPIKI